MKKFVIIMMSLCFANSIFAIDLPSKIVRTHLETLPFFKSKTMRLPDPVYAVVDDETANLPIFLYRDLGLQEKFKDPNTECILCRKFQMNDNFDFVALDILISEWSKQLLATYRNGELIDYIECEISWTFLFIKQWRITAEKEIIVTSLNVESSTPISGLSDFDKVNAQRIDTYYKVDDSGKFYETKQVKYKPQVYTKAYLEDRNKNIWEGDEVIINN